MKTVFISYRREDSAGYTRSLYNSLTDNFSDQHVFMDVDDIKAGTDFIEEIEKRLQGCQALLVMIGKRWLDILDEEGHRRLDNPNDWVRVEIAVALQRKIRVIPVLIEGTTMPQEMELPDDLKPLARRQALTLTNDGFEYQIARVVKVLSEFLPVKYEKPVEGKQSNQSNSNFLFSNLTRLKTIFAKKPTENKKSVANTVKNVFMWIGIIVVVLITLTQFADYGEIETSSSNKLNPALANTVHNKYDSNGINLAGVWYDDRGSKYFLEQTNNKVTFSSIILNGMQIMGEINGYQIPLVYSSSVSANSSTFSMTSKGYANIENDLQHIQGQNPDGSRFRLHRGHLPQK